MNTFLQKLDGVDRRVIFLIIAVVVILPLIFPLGLPVEPTQTTIDAFEAIDAIPPGAKVLMSFDYGPSTKPEIHPMSIAVLRHLFHKGHPVIVMCLWPDGLFMAKEALDQVALDEYKLTYGTDFVNLGYRPGNEAIIKGITQSFEANFTMDAMGTLIRELPIMKDVENIDDAAFIINMSAGFPGAVEWIQYAADPHKIPMTSGNTSIQVNEVLPYVKSGQMQGIIAGMPAAAEYEALIRRAGITEQAGEATSSMDAQSIAHLVIVLFIVLGNISYFVKRKQEKKY